MCWPATSARSRDWLRRPTPSIVDQTDRLARVVRSRLDAGDVVGILGLAYKPDTAVIDESPGVALARLLGRRATTCIVYDPVAMAAARRPR